MAAGRPLLAVLTGPSGAGKDVLAERLRQRDPSLAIAITATTRPPRHGERHGIDYLFVSEAELTRLADTGELLESATVYGYRYGVPRGPIRAALARGQTVLVKTDIQGATTIRRAVPGAVTIFLAPPSLAVLERRLRARGGLDEDVLARRLSAARSEMELTDHFDHAVVNYEGGLDAAVESVQAILLEAAGRVDRPLPSV